MERGGFHHVPVHLIAHAFPGVWGPLGGAGRGVIGHEASVVTGDLGVSREYLDGAAASG